MLEQMAFILYRRHLFKPDIGLKKRLPRFLACAILMGAVLSLLQEMTVLPEVLLLFVCVIGGGGLFLFSILLSRTISWHEAKGYLRKQ